MHYCLSKIELQKIINHKIYNNELMDDELKILFEQAENYDISFGLFTYFFAMILEKNNNRDNLENLIKEFYLLENSFFSNIHQMDHVFVDHLVRNVREKGLSLEEELIRLQTNLTEYKYDQTIRF